MNWNPAVEPFIARWSHPTGDRLTRSTDTVQTFATEAEAIAAISANFGPNTSDAHVVEVLDPVPGGRCRLIAKRKRGKKLTRVASR